MEFKRSTSTTRGSAVLVSARRPSSAAGEASGRVVQRCSPRGTRLPGSTGRSLLSSSDLAVKSKRNASQSALGTNSTVSSPGHAFERSNSSFGNSGRQFQRTNSTVGRQKGEAIRQRNRFAVYCRVRAFQDDERTGKEAELAVQMKEGTVEVAVPNKGQFTFSFDGCFWSCGNRESVHHKRAASQEDVFDEVGRPLVENVLAGYNASIMAYGQTGSGKTYTTHGPVGSLGTADEGLVPRACNMIFARAATSAQKGLRYTVRVSMVEVYLEEVFDLLNNRKPLSLRSGVNRNTIFFVNAKKVEVHDVNDIVELLGKAENLRTFAETKIHDHSSRAHTLFTLEVQTDFEDPGVQPRCARLLIADLAGSERIREAGTEEGIGFEQARNINLSLLHLGSCFEAVALRGGKYSNASIPEFRNSTLTKLLKDYLGGNSVSVMMVTIAPSVKNAHLSVQTLRFGDRAQQITTHAKLNLLMGDDEDEDPENVAAQEDYAVKKEALYAEFHLKNAIKKLAMELRALEKERKACPDDSELAKVLDKKIADGERELADLEHQLACQRKILYAPVCQLEETVCELQLSIQKLRLDHEEESERLRQDLEQRMVSFRDSQQAIMAQHETVMAEKRARHRQAMEEAKDEIAALRQLVASLQADKQRLEKEMDDLSQYSRAREKELREKLESTQQLLEEAMTARKVEEERWAVRLQEQEDITQEHIQAHAETTAALDETVKELEETAEKLESTQALLEEVQQHLSDNELVLEETTNVLSDTVAAKDALQEGLTEKEKQLVETTAALDASKSQEEETQKLLSETEGVLQQTAQELEETKVVLEETQEKLSETEAVLEETTAALGESKALQEETQKQLSETEVSLQDTSNELADTKATLEETQQKLSETEGILEETTMELTETVALQEQTQEKLTDVEGVLQGTNNELMETRALHEDAQRNLEETTEALKDTQQKLSKMEMVLEETTQALTETEAVKEDTQQKVTETEVILQESKAALEETKALQDETYQKLSKTEAVLDESRAELAETKAEQKQLEEKLSETEAVLEETSNELAETKAMQEETQEKLVETEGVLEEMAITLQKTEEAKKEVEEKLTDTEVVLEQLQGNLVEREQELLARSAFLDETQEKCRAFFDDMLEGFDEKHYAGVDTLQDEVIDWVSSMEELVLQHEVIRKVLRNINEEVKVVDKPREVRGRLSRVSSNSLK